MIRNEKPESYKHENTSTLRNKQSFHINQGIIQHFQNFGYFLIMIFFKNLIL